MRCEPCVGALFRAYEGRSGRPQRVVEIKGYGAYAWQFLVSLFEQSKD